MYRQMNKKGADIPSVIFIVVTLLAIGILFFFTNHITQNIFDSFGNAIEDMPNYNANTTAVTSIRSIESQNARIWDYAFLFIVIGMMLALMISAFSTQASPIFYWVYGILAMLMFTLAIIMSNIWVAIAADDAMASTLANFPIMNALLGTYYPTLILAVLIIGMILFFGKRGQNDI